MINMVNNMKTIKIKDIRPFDIMLEGSNSKVSNIIQKVIDEKFSHSAVFFEVITSNGSTLYVHESDRFGLRNSNFEKYYNKSKYGIYIARPKNKIVTMYQAEDLMHLSIETAGHKGYDFMNLLVHQPIKAAWKWLTGKELWVGKHDEQANGRFICSERTAFIMNKYFYNEPEWYKISTEHFANSDQYEVFKLEK